MKKNIEKSEAPNQDADYVGAGQGADAEDRERHKRFTRPQLDRDEGGEQDQGDGEQDKRFRRSPAGFVGVDHRVDEDREGGGDGDRPGNVEDPCLV
jgi:hypothetical protein